MTDTSTKAVEDLITEIEAAFTCRCEAGYTDRGLHAPDCQGYMLPGATETLRALLAEREALREENASLWERVKRWEPMADKSQWGSGGTTNAATAAKGEGA